MKTSTWIKIRNVSTVIWIFCFATLFFTHRNLKTSNNTKGSSKNEVEPIFFDASDMKKATANIDNIKIVKDFEPLTP